MAGTQTRIVGIDLGTTNSAMAYLSKGRPAEVKLEYVLGEPVVPSAVVLLRDGAQTRVRVGTKARQMLTNHPDKVIISVKRLMGLRYNEPMVQKALPRLFYRMETGKEDEIQIRVGDETYTPVEISAMILWHMKREAERKLKEEVTDAVITVPAYFGEPQKYATLKAGRIAGMTVRRLLPEPTAAAYAFGLEREDEDLRKILVYDLGGGTFDISVMMTMGVEFQEVARGGDMFLGGDDLDLTLVDRAIETLRRQGVDAGKDGAMRLLLKQAAENCKIELSDSSHAGLECEAVAGGAGGRAVNLSEEISRDEFEGRVQSLVDKTMEITRAALKRAELPPEEIDHVLLVGGSTRVPMVRERLAQEFGEEKLRFDINPMLCVGLGAAVATALPAVEHPPMRPGEEEEEAESRRRIAALFGEAAPAAPVRVDMRKAYPVEVSLEDRVEIQGGAHVLSHDVGIEVEDSRTGQAIVAKLLSQGDPADSKSKKTFRYPPPGKGGLLIPVYQAREGTLDPTPDSANNVLVGSVEWKPSPEPAQGTSVEVSIGFDESEVCDVRVSIAGRPEERLPRPSRVEHQEPSAAEKVTNWKEQAEQRLNWSNNSLMAGRQYRAPREDLDRIERLRADLQRAYDRSDSAACERIGAELEQAYLNSPAFVLAVACILRDNGGALGVSGSDRGELERLLRDITTSSNPTVPYNRLLQLTETILQGLGPAGGGGGVAALGRLQI